MTSEFFQKISKFAQGFGNESPGRDELISDEEIVDILSRFSPILHRGIAEANSFFMRSAGQKLTQAVPMTFEELNLWQKNQQIVDRTMQVANTLYVPILDIEDQDLLERSDEGEFYSSSNKGLALRGGRGRKYRVNLDEVIHVPIQPLEPRNLQFLIKPHAHLGGMGERNSLYNAFIGLDTFVLDEYNRWIVKAIPGTTPGVDGPNWGEGPVYSPYRPARSSVWFNTSVDTRKPNTLEVYGQGQFDLMFHCEIHHPEQLSQLEIPGDERLRFFFWQLGAFIKNRPLGNGGDFLALGSG